LKSRVQRASRKIVARAPLWSRIEQVAPSEVTLTANSTVLLRVRGTGLGFLCVGARKRWVWGRFNEVFEVDPRRVKRVALRGLFGTVRHSLAFRPWHDLSPPRPSHSAAPRLAVRVESLECVPQQVAVEVRISVPSLALPAGPQSFQVQP
jgi:hypothetical protein